MYQKNLDIINIQIESTNLSQFEEPSDTDTRSNRIWSNGLAVTINIAGTTETDYEDITNRIHIYNHICMIKHENIQQFYGTWVNGDLLHLVFELPQEGQLINNLHKFEENNSLRIYDILKVLYGISRGLAHLHLREIIHGNIRGFHTTVNNLMFANNIFSIFRIFDQ